MLTVVQKFFAKNIVPAVDQGETVDQEHGYQLATAALLIEMARADFEVKAVEQHAVARAIRRAFELSEAETDQLIRLAEL